MLTCALPGHWLLACLPGGKAAAGSPSCQPCATAAWEWPPAQSPAAGYLQQGVQWVAKAASRAAWRVPTCRIPGTIDAVAMANSPKLSSRGKGRPLAATGMSKALLLSSARQADQVISGQDRSGQPKHPGLSSYNAMFAGMQRGMCTPAMSPKAFEAAMQKPTTLTGSSSPLMSRIRTPLAPKPCGGHNIVSKGRSTRYGHDIAWRPARQAVAASLLRVVYVHQRSTHPAGRAD